MTLRIQFSALLCALTLALTAACGEQIGDECTLSTDCSSQGDRICDVNSPGGYCTVIGCDVDTCPDEAVCVRFFPVIDTNSRCVQETEDRGTNDCSADEVCTLSNTCAPRNAEVRYCMLECESGSDCREDYECRGQDLMKEHGGEPVPEAGKPPGSKTTNFCAAKPVEES